MGKDDPPVLREPLKSWHRTIKSAPSYTIGERNRSHDSAMCATEFGPDVSKMVDSIRTVSPKWSMRPRGKGGLAGNLWVPGPGKYELPMSTVQRTHPTVARGGLGWNFGTTDRPNPGGPRSDAPCPTTYNARIDHTIARVPSWPMAQKLGSEFSPKPKPGEIRDVRETTRRGGPTSPPKWTMRGRGEKAERSSTPGPGWNTWHVESLGKLKRAPSWGFGSARRFPKEPEPSIGP
mmetsp:Transcript_28086/g.51535  ORF Transcript_28086/g.51535 Transcript_28086/m.51535 type:complete len:234 (-) Transcript_28086:91-792(-)